MWVFKAAASFGLCYNTHQALVYTDAKLFGCTVQLQTLHKELWKLQLQLRSDFGFWRESTRWLFLFSVDWWLYTPQPNGWLVTFFWCSRYCMLCLIKRGKSFLAVPYSGRHSELICVFTLAEVLMLEALPSATLASWPRVWLHFQGRFFFGSAYYLFLNTEIRPIRDSILAIKIVNHI